MSKDFKFPEINEELWKDFKSGSVPKDKTREMIEDGLKFLIDIQLLKKSEYLTEEALRKSTQKVREVVESLGKLKEKHNLVGLVQNLLGRKIEEMTKEENDGDVQTSFNRLEVLTLEAHAHGSLREHSKAAVDAIRQKNEGMISSYLVKVNVFNRETRTREALYFLPDDWTTYTQKKTAWHLRNLQIRTTTRWMKEKGFEPRKRETPVETPEAEEKESAKTPAESKPEKPEKTESEPKEKPALVQKAAPKKNTKKKVVENKKGEKKANAQRRRVAEKAVKKADEADIKEVESLTL